MNAPALSSPRATHTLASRSWLRISLLVIACLFALSPRHAAAQCPGSVTTDQTLTSSIVAPSSLTGACITVAADNLTINLGVHSIDISPAGDAAIAIDTGTHNNVTIVGTSGSIITAYTNSLAGAAIESAGGTGLTISGLNILNEPVSALCTLNARNQNWGTGVAIAGMAAANISGNTIQCFQTGISISNSAVARRATGLISGNTLTNDEYNNFACVGCVIGGPFELGTGIVLSNSSGWTIQNNGISFDGSLNAGLTCSDLPNNPTTDPTDCSPAVELLAGSSGNVITGNTVTDNFSAGIFAASTTSGNKILNNSLTNNLPGDLWDAAPPHSNVWRGNSCQTELGNVAPQRCPH